MIQIGERIFGEGGSGRVVGFGGDGILRVRWDKTGKCEWVSDEEIRRVGE